MKLFLAAVLAAVIIEAHCKPAAFLLVGMLVGAWLSDCMKK